MNSADISVIVPIYNTEEYLEECLLSLTRQGDISLQVILVDDGSKDGSGAIAERFCKEHSGFEYHLVVNGGPGRARNIGAGYANGKYLAFLDSDDIFADGILKMMLERAEKDGSDVAICNVCHVDSSGISDSPLHRKVFRTPKHVTHIRESQDLLYDTTIWNKLILRSFYEGKGITWPEGMFYEDIPVATSIHYLSNQVSVVNTTGYYWRVRDGETRSTTQKIADIRNLQDRVKALKLVDDFFASNVTEEDLSRSKQLKAVNTDMKLYLRQLPFLDPVKAQAFIDLINEYTATAIDDETFDRLKLYDRQIYKFIREGDLNGAVDLLSYKDYRNAPVTEENGRLQADLPCGLFSLPDRDITDEVSISGPVQKTGPIKFSHGKLEINTDLYYERVNIESPDDQQVKAFLFNDETGLETELTCIPYLDSKLTETEGIKTDMSRKLTSQYNYDGTGVKIIADLTDEELIRKHRGRNLVTFNISNRITEARGMLRAGSENLQRYDRLGRLIGSNAVSISCSIPGVLMIDIDDRPLVLEELLSDERGTGLRFNREIGSLRIRCKDYTVSDAFMAGTGTDHYFDPEKTGEYGGTLFHYEECGNMVRSERVYAADRSTKMIRTGEKGLAVNGVSNKGVQIISDDISVTASGVSKKDGEICIGIAVYIEHEIPDEARLVIEEETGTSTVLAVTALEDGEDKLNGLFTIDLKDGEGLSEPFSRQKDLYAELFKSGKLLKRVKVFCEEPCNSTCRYRGKTITIKRSSLLTLKISVSSDSEEGGNSKEKRRSLIANIYHGSLYDPLQKNTVLFVSSRETDGENTGQMLCESLSRFYPELQCVWAGKRQSASSPDNVQIVKKGYEDYYRYLAIAGTVIFENRIPPFFEKRDAQNVIDLADLIESDQLSGNEMILRAVEDIVISDSKKTIRRRLFHRMQETK